jgi:hypothetical protein
VLNKWIVIGVVVLMAVIVKFWPENGGDVSESVFGVYVTEDSRYVDRQFRLSQQIVVFGTGEDEEVVYSLTDIRQMPDQGRSLYTITFQENRGEEIQQSFYFDDQDQGEIEFKNNPDVLWTKVEDDQ